MKTVHCTRCGNLVFFENFSCNQCRAVLGFVPSLQEICAFEGDDETGWKTSQRGLAGHSVAAQTMPRKPCATGWCRRMIRIRYASPVDLRERFPHW
ncbi:zinc-ribbon domain-containing protein [Cupriavidus sp. USMAA2-4]|uniref:zinc-ribbon domain-containing protein n=1 Tax=Cupriavidus sp. USMAA2-4 TaxID=876364 RepID=UPI003FA471D3